MRITFVGVMVPLLWGANCNPDPAPQCAMPMMCGDERMMECIDTCSPIANEGDTCVADPCIAEWPICDYNLACVDGTCQRPGNQGFDFFFCTVGATSCTTGNYCRQYTEDGGSFPEPDNLPEGYGYDGQCVAVVPEGSRCDGDWTEAGGLGRLCHPGTRCLTDPRGDGSERACFRVCEDHAANGDCPCPSSDRDVLADCLDPNQAPGLPPDVEGICATCIENDEACEPNGWGCCETMDSCEAGECCRIDGLNCAVGSEECCASSECGTDGVCHPCPDVGGAWTPEVGCCEGRRDLERRGDICARPCREELGGPCSPPSCPTNPGSWVCTVEGDFCQASEGEEVCDGVDNDCAGGVDDVVQTDCEGPPLPSEDGYFQGCPGLSLPGRTACREVEGVVTEVCEVTEGFCAWDNYGNMVDRSIPGVNECFTGGLSNCEVTGCMAGEWCCWVDDVYDHRICNRVGMLNLPGSEDIAIDDLSLDCWLPGEPSTASCPAEGGCEDAHTCGGCVVSGCGWCEPYNTCLEGDDLGPSNGADCGAPGVGWIQQAALCELGCMDYFSCSSCTDNPDCGYCVGADGTRRCLPGNDMGPTGSSCSGDDEWIRSGPMCPSGAP